jgi:hypothetical protein
VLQSARTALGPFTAIDRRHPRMIVLWVREQMTINIVIEAWPSSACNRLGANPAAMPALAKKCRKAWKWYFRFTLVIDHAGGQLD